ncbi:MAG TPA: hypothetical protein VGM03_21325 [Phycisphaerae bacterium]|jgi:hypothetical protein
MRQHELVILRRLRHGPLTEFELVQQVAEHSGYSGEQAAERIGAWLETLKSQGYIWTGKLYNEAGQFIHAAALTRTGRDLVG